MTIEGLRASSPWIPIRVADELSVRVSQLRDRER
jgi:hypothetical protein